MRCGEHLAESGLAWRSRPTGKKRSIDSGGTTTITTTIILDYNDLRIWKTRPVPRAVSCDSPRRDSSADARRMPWLRRTRPAKMMSSQRQYKKVCRISWHSSEPPGNQ